MLQERIALLKNRNFSLLLIGNMISVTGGGLCYIALTWYVLSFHNHISSVIINSLCFWLPSTILGPFAGIWIDRLPRKLVYLFCNLVRAISFLTFTIILWHSPNIYWCYGLNALNGALFALLGPSGFALVNEIVKKEDLVLANATMNIVFEVGNIVGMGLAGILLQWLGIISLFSIVGGFVFFGAIIIFFIRIPKERQFHQNSTAHVFKDMTDAWHYLCLRPELLLVYIINLFVLTQLMTSPVVLAPFVKLILHGSAHTFSIIEVFLSIGLIVGSLFMPKLQDKIGWLKTVLLGVSITGIGLAALHFVHSIPLTMGIYAINGVWLAVWALVAARAQTLTTPSFQGRLQSFFMSASGTFLILFYLVLDRSTTSIPVADYYLILASFSLVSCLCLWLIHRHRLKSKKPH
jgi:MFS family permease